MANEDEGSKSGQKQPKAERNFSQEQYDILKSCSEKKDITDWNLYRKENRDKKVLLKGADLRDAHLSGANLQDANLMYANLQGSCLFEANLQHGLLVGANLQGAFLLQANLKISHLAQANLQGADLENANLHGALLTEANLKGASLIAANLQDVFLMYTKLQSADFSKAIIDGKTMIWNCEVDRKTKCEGVGLGSVRISPQERQLLEYNIRRMNWEEWYKYKDWYEINPKEKRVIIIRALMLFIRWFWSLSDYGKSTLKIIAWFFGLALLFAGIYRLWPGCVLVNGIVGDIKGFVHALYFSVVTMTTLGFGDIAANPDSWQGQVLLMVQVILGYGLLGALVTRFAVLFTAGGPAGKFSPIKTKEKEEDEKKKGE